MEVMGLGRGASYSQGLVDGLGVRGVVGGLCFSC